ncbi:MAG: zinc-binding dehydrogenase [Rhizobiales bacterium NRL2]|jgi:Zn-dependent alcohol dehydrogenase|nr:MAG: zinc-binding dehydrogenase [Rhizobiales bacterium NRL2]
MKAAVCRAFGEPLAIEEVRLAGPGPGEVRVRLAACAICHSDILFADGGWGGELPAVYGHEAAGVVEAVGDNVAGLAVGDHVVVTLIRACGECPACARGQPVTCGAVFPLDMASPLSTAAGESLVQGLRTGAFAESVTVDHSQAVVIPKDVPLQSASLLACGVITGFGAVSNTAWIEAGATVAVIGAGGVGLNSIQGAALSGASVIFAADLSDAKLETARAFGATHAVNPQAEDLIAAVRAATGGRGVDYVFVTVGVRVAVEQALQMAAPGGAVVLVGMPPSGVTVDLDPGALAGLNQRILGSKMGGARIQADIPFLVELYRQGRLKLDELISGRFPLERINEAMDQVRRGEALRNVIVFGDVP